MYSVYTITNHYTKDKTVKRYILCTLLLLSIPALLLCGCAGNYAVGYPIQPYGGDPVTYTTPIMVREFADRRPIEEKYEPEEAEEYRFYSRDIDFKDPVQESITRAFQLELANAGFEVADSENHIIGSKPFLRISGDILHFNVTRKLVPIDTMQHDVDTLWRRERYTVKVAVRLRIIDAKARRKVMQRVYESSDSAIMRSEMIDARDYASGTPMEEAQWEMADNQFCIDMLNEHLKRVLVRARRDIVALMAPARRPAAADTE